jgi:TRAP-type C4-dicarboxylate transport system permease small subunit
MARKILDCVDRFLSFLEEWTLFLTVMVALISLFVNVVLRYGFNYSLAWSEELVREVIIYTTFIGCCVAVRNRAMIKVDAAVQIFPILKRPLTFFGNICLVIFSGILIYYGWKMAELQVLTSQKTIILKIPLVYLYAILPVSGTMMLIRSLQVIFEDAAELIGKRQAPDQGAGP